MFKFVKNELRLSANEVNYWRKNFGINILVGSELEIEFERYPDDSMINDIRDILRPTNDLGKFGNGVYSVKGDGSLRDGKEIIVPGRQVNGLLEGFSIFKTIENVLSEHDPRISSYASFHNHVLIDKSGVNKLQKPLPEVIFKNVFLLVQRFMPELNYITSTMPNDTTRYDYYCNSSSIREFDIANRSLYDLRNTLYSKYNAVSIKDGYPCDEFGTEIDDGKFFSKFHLEFRIADCSLYPVQQACLNILYKALVMKAISLSEFGLLDNSDIDTSLYKFKNDYDEEDEISSTYESIFDRTTILEIEELTESYREDDDTEDECDFSRMSMPINKENLHKLKSRTLSMIEFLANEIIRIDKTSLHFLTKLAISPISSLIKTDSYVNKYGYDLISRVNYDMEEELIKFIQKEDESLSVVKQLIATGELPTTTQKEWCDKAGELLACKEDISKILREINKTTPIKFEPKVGWYFE